MFYANELPYFPCCQIRPESNECGFPPSPHHIFAPRFGAIHRNLVSFSPLLFEARWMFGSGYPSLTELLRKDE